MSEQSERNRVERAAAVLDIYAESDESPYLVARKMLEAADAEPARIMHGRHCGCSACARQDWAEPGLAPCGMHGSSCPPRYDPWGYPGDPAPEEA